ncbi:MAG: hypothetical protein ACPKPY_09565 [Nitrososphaeraceae archaeon]
MTAKIKPKPCAYNCGTKIYWNSSANAYWEVFANKRHVCPYRPPTNSTNVQKPTQPVYKKYQKPRMDNSLEVLSGSPDFVKLKYEYLTDLIKEYNGRTHRSQSHVINNDNLEIIVYYEVPEGKREVKRRLNSYGG